MYLQVAPARAYVVLIIWVQLARSILLAINGDLEAALAPEFRTPVHKGHFEVADVGGLLVVGDVADLGEIVDAADADTFAAASITWGGVSFSFRCSMESCLAATYLGNKRSARSLYTH